MSTPPLSQCIIVIHNTPNYVPIKLELQKMAAVVRDRGKVMRDVYKTMENEAVLLDRVCIMSTCITCRYVMYRVCMMVVDISGHVLGVV